MSSYDAKKIEEYQLILMKNPRSKVFAALAETYRKMDMQEEALETAHKGVKHNPDYPSGLVALARILVDLKKFDDAVPHLERALSQRPENLLALRMKAHCFTKLKKIPEALKTYKSLLFVNPSDTSAQSFVKKWEFLEGADYDFDHPLVPPEEMRNWVENLPEPQALISTVDVFLSKEDFPGANRLLSMGLKKWPDDSEIRRRQSWVQDHMPKNPIQEVQKAFWKRWIQRIEQSKSVDPLQL